MVRTVRQMLSLLHRPDIRFVPWTAARCYATYGWTRYQVSRQLVTINFLGRDVAVHKKVAASLERVEARVRKVEHAKHYDHWKPRNVQCFNWRMTTSGRSRSKHSWAIALDINTLANHYGSNTTDIPIRVVQAFLDEGWRWGGQYSGTKDPMHFEKH